LHVSIISNAGSVPSGRSTIQEEWVLSDQEPDPRAQPGHKDIYGVIVSNPHGIVMAIRWSVVPLFFAAGACVTYFTGHDLLHAVVSILALLYAVGGFLVGFERSMDRRPQAVLRPTGIELRKSRRASLELIGWNTITSVSDIKSPGSRSLGRSDRGQRQNEFMNTALKSHFIDIRTSNGQRFRVHDPAPGMDLNSIRDIIVERIRLAPEP